MTEGFPEIEWGVVRVPRQVAIPVDDAQITRTQNSLTVLFQSLECDLQGPDLPMFDAKVGCVRVDTAVTGVEQPIRLRIAFSGEVSGDLDSRALVVIDAFGSVRTFDFPGGTPKPGPVQEIWDVTAGIESLRGVEVLAVVTCRRPGPTSAVFIRVNSVDCAMWPAAVEGGTEG